MNHRDAARLRIESAGRRRNIPLLRRPDYVKYHPGGVQIEAVYCKMCGGAVKSLIPDERYVEERTIKGKVVRLQRLVEAEHSNYAEVTISFDDGSKHVSPLCYRCYRGLTGGMLEDLYAADMGQWMRDELDMRGEVNWGLLAYRKPVGCVLSRHNGADV